MIVLKYLNKYITAEEKNACFQLCVAEKCTLDFLKGGKRGKV